MNNPIQKNIALDMQRKLSKIKEQLQRISCATEFVILTNICSLSLYYGNISEYLKFQKNIWSI